MKRRTLLFILLSLVAILAGGCSENANGKVLAIEKTKSYHRSMCPPVHMARTEEMTVAQARSLGLVPCKACKPDSVSIR